MIKKLTESQFNSIIKNLDVGKQTLDIAFGVLVEGKKQTYFVEKLGLTKGAVSQAVNRVWSIYKDEVPPGYEKLTVILPKHQAFIVKKWADDAKKKRDK
ncbi:TPA: transcriptional regulator KorA [Proteus mirabilis]|uniref:transcriptional regulator KorA n=1 Tax=Proteus mirabilis TaxID=584 RepID=UPI00217CD8D9|nr:transcriptional regulator KorA [Proteus mirabilis]MCS6748149.1 transcriptional regulator KorA [Proteus mirabilis]HEK2843850.1 transcriptional regulator KorA [Proteus mirabilis]